MFIKYLNNLKLMRDYVRHNKSYFKKKNCGTNIFLVEFNGWQAMHIAFSYLANYFSEKKNCTVVAFESYSLFKRERENFFDKLKWNLGKIFKLKTFGIYSSFGTRNFLAIKYNELIIKKSIKQYNYFYKKNCTLRKLESLRVENIWIGDLIYDSYLKKYSSITIELNSQNFKFFFLECLKNFYYWLDYFNQNKVKGVVVGHSVYVSAIPLRIADYKKILNFNFSAMSIVNCSKTISYKNKQNSSDIHSRYFKKIFKKFKKLEIKNFLEIGKKYLNKIVTGKSKYAYLTKSTFSKLKNSINYFNNNKKIKVVIYSHLFTDSPHILGNHFFTDFKEWFIFLQKIIKKTDYDWYIKPHPQEDKTTKKTIKIFLKNNRNIKLLPKNLSNLYLAKKIDYALTVFGTVASELPVFGVKVISASRNNPHYDYNFSINPKNIINYEQILLNLKKNKFQIKLKDLYEYHYMKQNYAAEENSYIFSKALDYIKIDKESGRQVRWTNLCYRLWLSKFSKEEHIKIKKIFEKFVGSGSYMMMPNGK